MGKFREFIDDRFPWSNMEKMFGDNEMITEAVIIVRVLKTDEFNASGEMPERVQAFMSTGCGVIMTKGMLLDTEEQLAWENVENHIRDLDEDDDDGTSGV